MFKSDVCSNRVCYTDFKFKQVFNLTLNRHYCRCVLLPGLHNKHMVIMSSLTLRRLHILINLTLNPIGILFFLLLHDAISCFNVMVFIIALIHFRTLHWQLLFPSMVYDVIEISTDRIWPVDGSVGVCASNTSRHLGVTQALLTVQHRAAEFGE